MDTSTTAIGKGKRPVDSVTIGGTRVIPSDTFTLGDNRYILMDIWEDEGTGMVELEITGMTGAHMAKTALVPLVDFENSSPANFGMVFTNRLAGENAPAEQAEKPVAHSVDKDEEIKSDNIRSEIEEAMKEGGDASFGEWMKKNAKGGNMRDNFIIEEENTIPQTTYVRSGEGITHTLARQIDENPTLGESLSGNSSFEKAMTLAERFGYLDSEGKEIRVIHRHDAAYLLAMENGRPVIREYLGGLDDNTDPIEIQHEEAKQEPTEQVEKERPMPVEPTRKEETPQEKEVSKAVEKKPTFPEMSDEEVLQTREFLLPETANISLSSDMIRAIFEIPINTLVEVMPKYPSQIRDTLSEKKPEQVVEEMRAKDICAKYKIKVDEVFITKLAYIARAIRDMDPGLEDSGKTVYEFTSGNIHN